MLPWPFDREVSLHNRHPHCHKRSAALLAREEDKDNRAHTGVFVGSGQPEDDEVEVTDALVGVGLGDIIPYVTARSGPI